MPKKSLEHLTESMFYVLMALRQGNQCGVGAAGWIERRTSGRVRIGPATLYTILAKFQGEDYIREISVEGRRRTYAVTEKGLQAYDEEVIRLRQCLSDAQAAEAENEGGEALLHV